MNCIDKYKFTEKERDTETGLDYFGARYYNSALGMWLSVDPLMDKYPGWSPYNYTFGNPLKYIDPNGMGGDETSNWFDQMYQSMMAVIQKATHQEDENIKNIEDDHPGNTTKAKALKTGDKAAKKAKKVLDEKKKEAADGLQEVHDAAGYAQLISSGLTLATFGTPAMVYFATMTEYCGWVQLGTGGLKAMITLESDDVIQVGVDGLSQLTGYRLKKHFEKVISTNDFEYVNSSFQQVNNYLWFSISQIPRL